MLLLYSKVIGLPIVEMQTQTRVGTVSEIILDNENLSISALAIRELFQKIKVVSAADIMQIVKNGVVVHSSSSVELLDESVRIKKLSDQKYFGVGQSVITESGKKIGKVYDYLINTSTNSVSKIYVKSLFKERIIPIKKIVCYLDGEITIKDDKEIAAIESIVPENISA